MLREIDGKVAHFPGQKFEFDEEVSSIFDDMAERSLPLYRDSRMLTVNLAESRIRERMRVGKESCVLDVGASTGAFCLDLAARFTENELRHIRFVAVDCSEPMAARLRERLPFAQVYVQDASQLDIPEGRGMFDVIVAAYVAQFIRPWRRVDLWNALYAHASYGCVMCVSEKEEPSPYLGAFASRPPGHPALCVKQYMDDEYRTFRLVHGKYTKDEIEAKTEALKSSMWPVPFDRLLNELSYAGFVSAQCICRWLHFHTTVAVK